MNGFGLTQLKCVVKVWPNWRSWIRVTKNFCQLSTKFTKNSKSFSLLLCVYWNIFLIVSFECSNQILFFICCAFQTHSTKEESIVFPELQKKLTETQLTEIHNRIMKASTSKLPFLSLFRKRVLFMSSNSEVWNQILILDCLISRGKNAYSSSSVVAEGCANFRNCSHVGRVEGSHHRCLQNSN